MTARGFLSIRAGDAEIDQLGLIAFRDKNIGWRKVSVDDQVAVRVSDGITNLQEQREALIFIGSRLVDPIEQRNAVDLLHDKIWLAIVTRTAIEQLCDMRVLELGEDLPFTVEARHEIFGKNARLDQLDRHGMREISVISLGGIYRPHPADTDQAGNTIGPDTLGRSDLFQTSKRRARVQGIEAIRVQYRTDALIQIPVFACLLLQPSVLLVFITLEHGLNQCQRASFQCDVSHRRSDCSRHRATMPAPLSSGA